MQADRNIRVLLNRRFNQFAQERLAGIFARPGRGLQNDRRIAGFGGLHDGEHSL